MSTNYMKDHFTNSDTITISIKDISISRGYGVNDYIRVYKGIPFRLDDHLDRFFESLRLLKLTPQKTSYEIKHIICKGIRVNNYKNCDIKMVQTGGTSEDGFSIGKDQQLIITFFDSVISNKLLYSNGCKVQTFLGKRTTPKAKSTNYTSAILEFSNHNNISELIYMDYEGNLFEGSRSNLFFIQNGTLITPKDNILEGVTRKVILEIADNLKLKIDLRPIHFSEIGNVDEAFITNTSKEIMPISNFNGVPIKVGPITKNLMKEFKVLVC